MKYFKLIILFVVLWSGPRSVYGQSDLTIEQIMQGPDFVGHLPSQPTWSVDGKELYFFWNPEGKPSGDWYCYDLEKEEYHLMSIEQQRDLPGRLIYSRDRSRITYAKNGDLFFMDQSQGEKIQVTNTLDEEISPQFSGDESQIIYRQGDNLFTWTIATGETRQWTHFKQGKKKDDPVPSPQAAWLERDQLEHFEVLSERSDEASYRETKEEGLSPSRPREIYIGDRQVWNIVASPDLSFIIYQLSKAPKDSKGTMVPDFVTAEGYINKLNARPKVGSPQRTFETWIYQVEADTHFQVDHKLIPGIFRKPAYYRDYHSGDSVYVDTFSKAREVSILGPFFNGSSPRGVVVVRSHDHKDRWIMEIDLKTGLLKTLDHQHDEAWIGGPGIGGWSMSPGNIGWINNDLLWFQSEETGFSHIYIYDFRSQTKHALTQGKFEVLDARLSNDRQWFYAHASKEGPFEHHFYRIPVDGGPWQKLTEQIGRNDVILSPDEENLAILHSYSNKPTDLFVKENGSPSDWKRVTESTTELFDRYSWRDPEIIHFKARDGVMVPARLYKPTAAKSNGAGIIFVHGAGYLHNVHKWWSSYYREFMFHNFLADQGYTVLDIDYRASAGYGRDWRTAIYRHMGGKDLSDQVDGAKYLVELQGIDAKRLGIYGGSYGGFITLMALCTAPGTFQCGAALRSVTDWAHYNHGYTSRILNTPVEDSMAYYRSSPIYHAQNLEGDLVMLHGMVDRNVQFQDVVRMTQRFLEAGKHNFELAVFPMEGHGFIEPSSWTDEYTRIYRLFEKNLRQ